MRVFLKVAALFAVVAPLWAQEAPGAPVQPPPRLELPKPAKPAPVAPSTVYTPPPPSKWDSPLMYSQISLAGAGTGATVAAQIRRYHDESKVPAFTSVGVVGLVIVLERAYAPVMSPKTKKWLSIANFAAAGVLSGLLTQDVTAARSTLNTTATAK